MFLSPIRGSLDNKEFCSNGVGVFPFHSAEYAVGNVVFARKIESLSKSFSNLRRTRGDGNCFYRAFLYSYLESLLVTSNMEECTRYALIADPCPPKIIATPCPPQYPMHPFCRFVECVKGWRVKLIDAGFQELVFEDPMELLLEQVGLGL